MKPCPVIGKQFLIGVDHPDVSVDSLGVGPRFQFGQKLVNKVKVRFLQVFQAQLAGMQESANVITKVDQAPSEVLCEEPMLTYTRWNQRISVRLDVDEGTRNVFGEASTRIMLF